MRQIITYKNYFTDFIKTQNIKVKDKINKCLDILKTENIISTKFVKKIIDDIYELRIKNGSDIFRIFFIFDRGNIVVLFNGFQKKTQKTPKNEIEKARRIRNEYYKEQKH